MFINPSEEGAAATSPSELVDKKWIAEQLSEMKEQITKDVTEKIIGEMHKCFPKFMDKSDEDNDPKKDIDETSKDEGKKTEKSVHVGVFCDNCDCQISGIRYKCADCEDFDLCEICENLPNIHVVKHVFLKIRHPLSPCTTIQKYTFPLKQVAKAIKEATESKPEGILDQKNIDAEFICDVTVPSGTVFSPGEDFVKRWKVRNIGRAKWDSCITVRMKRSHPSFQPLHTEVAVHHLDSFQEGIVTVIFKAPKTLGYFNSLWVFHHNDSPFGDELWCQIIVSDLVHDGLSPFSSLSPRAALIKHWKYEYPQCRMKHKCKDKHKKKEHGKKKIKPLLFDALPLCHTEASGSNHRSCKLVASHTATPNNTPLDLTPPKSPEPKELAEGKKEHVSAAGPKALSLNKKNNFGNLSSSESDSEFVIIPMPKCFDFLEPYKPEEHLKKLAKELTISVKSEIDALKRNEAQKEKALKIMKMLENNIDVSRKSSTESDFEILKNRYLSKNISQETGVPEHSENFSLCQETSQKCIASDNSDMKNSPSSSSISIIDSSGNNSPTSESSKLIQIDVNRLSIEKPKVVKPVIEISEAVANGSIVGTFPKFPIEGINAETDSLYGTKIFTQEAIDELMKYGNTQTVASDNVNSATTEALPEVEMTPIQQLIEMGFRNMDKNKQLLQKHDNDIVKVVEELVELIENEEYASCQSDNGGN